MSYTQEIQDHLREGEKILAKCIEAKAIWKRLEAQEHHAASKAKMNWEEAEDKLENHINYPPKRGF